MNLLSTALASTDSNGFPPERKAVECTPRNGLPNFFAKAAAGGDVRVGYLGGSITAQPGYRVLSLAHLRTLYPNTPFHEIHAAIGGTGSDLGVLRIGHDVFPGKPDLLFVEFAVNDRESAPADILRSMEGIVRKTWRAFPECDICFVYTFTSHLLPELQAGHFNRSAAVMEAVADRYGIPSIHMGLEAVRLEQEGRLLMMAPEAKVERVSGDELNQASPIAVNADGKIPFSQDGVHPYLDTGHRLYLEAIARSLPNIKAMGESIAPHSLPPPLDSENDEDSVMLSVDPTLLSGSWTRLPEDWEPAKALHARVDSLWKGEPGAELSFRFKGRAAKMYDLLGPDCGRIEVTVDGKTTRLQRMDGYCTYRRLALLNLASGLDPATIHEVKVRVLADPLDKKQILFERNRGDFEKNPANYEGTRWYVGALFLFGERMP